jgi:hypothetical protein
MAGLDLQDRGNGARRVRHNECTGNCEGLLGRS